MTFFANHRTIQVMKISIIAVGKIKEKYLTAAVEEYGKRLSRYCSLQIVELPDEKTPENASALQQLQIKEREGERILGAIRPDAYVMALAIEGQMPDSVKFSRKIEQLGVRGISHIQFVIGGSLGLSPQVLSRADELISFSAMTFPHQLMRVILLEQIYRAFRIARGEPYHK